MGRVLRKNRVKHLHPTLDNGSLCSPYIDLVLYTDKARVAFRYPLCEKRMKMPLGSLLDSIIEDMNCREWDTLERYKGSA
jgi:hypothetical protein